MNGHSPSRPPPYVEPGVAEPTSYHATPTSPDRDPTPGGRHRRT